MIGRRFIEDDTALVVSNAEPFRKPDHRAKKHPRPVGSKKRPMRVRVRFSFERCGLDEIGGAE